MKRRNAFALARRLHVLQAVSYTHLDVYKRQNMRYPGGVLVTLDASWSRTRHFPYGRDLTLRLVGTKGNIYVDYFSPNNEVYAPGERIYSYYAEDKDQMMIDDLIQCYQEGRPFGITGAVSYTHLFPNFLLFP